MPRVNTNALTEEEIEYIEAAIIEEQTERIVGRTIANTVEVSPGTLNYTFWQETDMSPAEVVGENGNFPYDTADRDKDTKYIEKLGKGFSISREAILAAREGGYPIDTRNARNVVKQIVKLEEDKIFDAAVAAATAKESATSDGVYAPDTAWDDAGVTAEAIHNDVNALFDLFDPYYKDVTDIVLEPKFYNKLNNINSYGLRPIEEIETFGINVNKLNLDCFTTDVNGLAFDRSDLALVIAEDMQSEEEYVMTRQGYRNQAFERVVAGVYDINSFCKLNLET